MLELKRYVNELMTSNCYVIYDEGLKHCIVVDPGSEKSLREIEFIRNKNFYLDYIIVSHEHTDHNWGVNSLYEAFSNSKLICTEECNIWVNKANRAYFLLYYDDLDYRYKMRHPDILINQDCETMDWIGHKLVFLKSPGHSRGAMCIQIDNMLFTGDTIMPFKPYFNGRDSNEDDWIDSVNKIMHKTPNDVVVYPGHGDQIVLNEWFDLYFEKRISII